MNGTATAAEAAQAKANRLIRAAAAHKRAAARHRRQLRETMQQLDQLRRECAALGITIIDNTAQGGTVERDT